ncbi:MAG: ABC transporter ATP-binding protein [Spirochaetales bacterium]|nr:ABC transporter ATP-binding protein [Spirochaetales bacterium]MCF7937749.1 ABC transporter ATP-binding protein [Spirochaetales bacterium]
MGNNVSVVCTNVTKNFGELGVLEDINLTVQPGEFAVFLGPSGCGKSTFLSLVAGFDFPSSGNIQVMDMDQAKPGKHVGFVFQEYALFPWKTVLGNVESGLLNLEKAERLDRAMFYLEKVGLEDFANEYPLRLSGGMKQRVGIARALAYDPDILLMDEPFGALDAQTRKYMQQELHRILEGFQKSVLFVTHSVLEAVYLADTVYVMSKRPARIVYREEIDLGEERHYTGDRFLQYREEILHYLNAQTGISE